MAFDGAAGKLMLLDGDDDDGNNDAALREPLLIRASGGDQRQQRHQHHHHHRSHSFSQSRSNTNFHHHFPVALLSSGTSKPHLIGFARSLSDENLKQHGEHAPQTGNHHQQAAAVGMYAGSGVAGCLDSEKAEKASRRVTLRLLVACCLVVFLCYVDRANLGLAAQQFLDDLGFKETTYGTGVSAFFVGYVVFQIPSTMILERLGTPLWMGVSLCVWGLSAMSTSFVKTPFQFYAVRFCLGVAESGTFPGVWYYLGLFIPEDRLTFAIAAVDVTLVMSQVASAPMAAAIMRLAGFGGLEGWQWLFLSEGLPTIALGLYFWFMMPKDVQDAKFLTPAEKEWLGNEIVRVREEKRGVVDKREGFYSQVMEAVFNINLWGCTLVYLLRLMGMYVMLFWSVLLIGSMKRGDGLRVCDMDGQCGDSGDDSNDSSVVMLATVPYSAAAAMTIFNGWHSQKTNERKLHAAIPFMLGASVFALVPVLSKINFFLAFMALTLSAVGAVSGGSPVTALATAHLSHSAKAFGLGLYNAVANLGGVIGPLITGYLVQRFNSYSPAILAMAGVLFVGGMVVGLLHDPLRATKHPPRKDQDEEFVVDDYVV